MKEVDLGRVDVIEFLTELDVRNVGKASEEEANFSCPFPGHSHGDEDPSGYMNLETTQWMCHGCKKRGNAITFLADLEKISPILARRFIRERFDSDFKEPEGGSMRQEIEAKLDRKANKIKGNDPIDESFLTAQEVDWLGWEAKWENDEIVPAPAHYMLDTRGFDGFVLDEWQVGYDEMSDRISIPVHDHHGELVGFKGRAYQEEMKPKYLVLGDRPDRDERFGYPCYLISQVVFGAWRARPKDGTIIVCEGELNVIALWQKGFENAVAVSGSNFSEMQRKIILDLADQIIVWFDTDPSGESGTKIVVNSLLKDVPVKSVPEHDGDPASLSMDSVIGVIDGAESVIRPW